MALLPSVNIQTRLSYLSLRPRRAAGGVAPTAPAAGGGRGGPHCARGGRRAGRPPLRPRRAAGGAAPTAPAAGGGRGGPHCAIVHLFPLQLYAAAAASTPATPRLHENEKEAKKLRMDAEENRPARRMDATEAEANELRWVLEEFEKKVEERKRSQRYYSGPACSMDDMEAEARELRRVLDEFEKKARSQGGS
ncbi:unnamed protein product [Closterium sp. Naga37s-1]|nr:unnamed protein product [Closterium sp. Naga37s-1]